MWSFKMLQNTKYNNEIYDIQAFGRRFLQVQRKCQAHGGYSRAIIIITQPNKWCCCSATRCKNNKDCGGKPPNSTAAWVTPSIQTQICFHTVRSHQPCGAADRLSAAEINRRNPPEDELHSQPLKPTSFHTRCEILSSSSVCHTANHHHTPTSCKWDVHLLRWPTDRPLWHIQPTIIYKNLSTLDVKWCILGAIEPLQLDC